MGYLTADTCPTESVCRALFIPNDEAFLAIVRGALEELTFSYNYDKYGTLTPSEMAACYLDMFDRFCFNEGICRVVGEVICYAGTTSPDPRWLLCDGSSLARVDYPNLFAAIGTVYGAPDGAHFSLPDLQGRVAIGVGSGSGLAPRALGDSFGEETHTLTIGELAAHDHTTGNSAILGTSAPPPFDALGPNPFPAITGSTGNDDPHNNMQPSLALNYFIVAE